MTGYDSKRDAAADKLQEPAQEPVSFPCCGYTDANAIRWNQFNGVVQCHMCGQVYTVAQPAQEPPSEWAGIKAILDEYGLQAIDFVADFKAALAQPAQEPDWKEQYEYQKRRAEMWIAKYEKDIGPLEKAQPAQEPRNVRERWNVELDGNDLLVCFNDHEKGDKCQYERYSPQREWAGLNEKERNDIEDDFYANISIHVFDAIEAKLKEKNNGT